MWPVMECPSIYCGCNGIGGMLYEKMRSPLERCPGYRRLRPQECVRWAGPCGIDLLNIINGRGKGVAG